MDGNDIDGSTQVQNGLELGEIVSPTQLPAEKDDEMAEEMEEECAKESLEKEDELLQEKSNECSKAIELVKKIREQLFTSINNRQSGNPSKAISILENVKAISDYRISARKVNQDRHDMEVALKKTNLAKQIGEGYETLKKHEMVRRTLMDGIGENLTLNYIRRSLNFEKELVEDEMILKLLEEKRSDAQITGTSIDINRSSGTQNEEDTMMETENVANGNDINALIPMHPDSLEKPSLKSQNAEALMETDGSMVEEDSGLSISNDCSASVESKLEVNESADGQAKKEKSKLESVETGKTKNASLNVCGPSKLISDLQSHLKLLEAAEEKMEEKKACMEVHQSTVDSRTTQFKEKQHKVIGYKNVSFRG
uniref:SHNi-TPR domain-containing protein n=1 Tax=Rhabditophanes sp. KR3021 TaxID=114890 RepID=A0AC35TVI9_9BILA